MRPLAPLPIVLFLLALAVQPAAAATPPKASPSLTAARARQAQLAQVRSELGASIAANLAAQDQLTQALAENRRQAEALSGELRDAQDKLDSLDAELAELDRRSAALQEQIDAERHQLDGLARALYVQPESVLVSLAEAGSLREALADIGSLQAAAGRARAIQQQLERDRAGLAEDRRRAAEDRNQAAAVRDGLRSKTDRLHELEDRQQSALQTLQDKLASSQAELAAASVQSAATAAYIAQTLAEEQAEAAAAAYQSVWEQVLLLAAQGGAGGAGPFADPLPGAVITQPFGPTDLVFEPAYLGFAHFHMGLDLAAPEGTPVLAAAGGVVLLAGYNPGGYGNYVVIGHAGGIDTLYGHLDSFAVRQGDVVAPGQPVGAEGSTGCSTGPHLHFEVRLNGQPVDPASYLTAR